MGPPHPHKFFKRVFSEIDISLPAPLAYSVGNVFLPIDAQERQRVKDRLKEIIEELENVLQQKPSPYNLVLDGEVMSANFQDLMKQVHRKDGKQTTDAVLHLFDSF